MKALAIAALLFAAPYIETFEVRVVNLDVIVTDPDGKPVQGLAKSDFEIRDEGRVQEISNFSEYVGGSAVTAVNAALDAAPVEAPKPLPRKFIFVIDDMALHPTVADKLGKQAIELVKTSMRPGDEGMILTPTNKNRILLPYTSDRDSVIRGIEHQIRSLAFHANTRQGMESRQFQRTLMGAELDMEAASHAKRYSDLVGRRVKAFVGELQAVVNASAEVEGKKVMVIVSNSLTSEPGKEAFRYVSAMGPKTSPNDTSTRSKFSEGQKQGLSAPWIDLRPMIAEVGRSAAANGMTIYCLAPDNAGLGTNTTGDDRSAPVMPPSFVHGIADGTIDTFNTLTTATGGRYLRGDGVIGDLFQQVSSDLRAYYSLGYHAPEGESGKPRTITVRVKGHPELTVRTRRETERKTPAKEMESRVLATLMFPNDRNELGIEATTGRVVRERDAVVVPVQIRVPLSQLTFLPDGDRYRGSFTVTYAASTERGDFGAGDQREQVLEVAAAQLEAAKKKFFTFETNLRVPAGKLTISVGVLDPLSRLSAFKTMSVEVK